jgi:antitoxin HicB
MLDPALPGCVIYGKTVEKAIEMARDAITGYVESLIEEGEAILTEEELIECRLTVEAHAQVATSFTSEDHNDSLKERFRIEESYVEPLYIWSPGNDKDESQFLIIATKT